MEEDDGDTSPAGRLWQMTRRPAHCKMIKTQMHETTVVEGEGSTIPTLSPPMIRESVMLPKRAPSSVNETVAPAAQLTSTC